MTTLILADGSYHFIGDSETARIAELIAAGAVVMGAPLPATVEVEQVDEPVTNDAPDVSVMSVREIKSWLETSPAVADAIDAFKQEQGNKHRKTALDSLQDYIRIDNG